MDVETTLPIPFTGPSKLQVPTELQKSRTTNVDLAGAQRI
jgi:hypothetical protein